MRRLKSFLLILIAVIVIPGSCFLLFRKNIVDFLSVSRPVNANCLIVEGWISENSLERAAEEFLSNGYEKLIVTGIPIESWYMMPEDGSFVFNFRNSAQVLDPGDSIIINMKGTQAKGSYAHFSLLINGEKAGDGFTRDEWKDYLFISDSRLELNELTIVFDNDDFYGTDDRNLYIGSVRINNIHIPARSEKTVVYNRKDPLKENPLPTNFSSVAAIAAHHLISIGIPENKIVVLPSKKGERNRTINSARAVNTWIEENLQQDKSFNIYSESIHSRRSWMVYKSELKINNERIGIIIPGEESDLQHIKINNRSIMREILGIIYYFILGLF